MNMFFMLLRYSIGTSQRFPEGLSEEDWRSIYKIAQQQSLLGVLFDGIQQNPAIRLERKLLLKWYAVSGQIKKNNEKANIIAVKVTEFFHEKGFRSCILKGQGNALNYSNAYARTSGDIDIWLEGGRKRVMQFANRSWNGLRMRYHHVEIPDVNGIPVEVHFMPSFMHNPWLNRRWQDWFKEQSNEQFCNKVDLLGQGDVCVPTNSFNVVYQMNHIYRHLFSEGIGLRQIVDYYYVLRKLRVDCTEEGQLVKVTDNEELVKTLEHLGIRKFAGALMWVLHEVLGMKNDWMLVPPNEKEGRFLLEEIMIGGNFGQYDTRLGSKKDEGKFRRYLRMTIRNFRIASHYPAEALCEPVFRTWYFFWRMWHKH